MISNILHKRYPTTALNWIFAMKIDHRNQMFSFLSSRINATRKRTRALANNRQLMTLNEGRKTLFIDDHIGWVTKKK